MIIDTAQIIIMDSIHTRLHTHIPSRSDIIIITRLLEEATHTAIQIIILEILQAIFTIPQTITLTDTRLREALLHTKIITEKEFTIQITDSTRLTHTLQLQTQEYMITTDILQNLKEAVRQYTMIITDIN